MKRIKCFFKGHELEQSIVNTINPNNWIKRCSCCGFYFMNGDIGRVRLTEKQAMKTKEDYEKMISCFFGKE